MGFPKPKVKLWDRSTLEQMVTKHPNVVSRLFPGALSDQGRLEALSSRFWNQMYFPGPNDLADMWSRREELDWTGRSLFTMLVGEFANGDIAIRPWALMLEVSSLGEFIKDTIANLLYLCDQASRYGVSNEAIFSATCYLVMLGSLKLPLFEITSIIEDPWKGIKEHSSDHLPVLHKCVVRPILSRIKDDLRRLCTQGCSRVSVSDEFHRCSRHQDWSSFLLRFVQRDGETSAEHHHGTLVVYKKSQPCLIDAPHGKHICALMEEAEGPIDNELSLVRHVLMARMSEAEY